METHYILEDEVNDLTLKEFVYNYSTGILNRALKSSIHVTSNHTHGYPDGKNCESGSVCIRELDANTFLSTVMQQNKVRREINNYNYMISIFIIFKCLTVGYYDTMG